MWKSTQVLSAATCGFVHTGTITNIYSHYNMVMTTSSDKLLNLLLVKVKLAAVEGLECRTHYIQIAETQRGVVGPSCESNRTGVLLKSKWNQLQLNYYLPRHAYQLGAHILAYFHNANIVTTPDNETIISNKGKWQKCLVPSAYAISEKK